MRTQEPSYGVRRQAKRDAALPCVCAVSISSRALSSQSGVALRLPPHSIESRGVTDGFNHTFTTASSTPEGSSDKVNLKAQWILNSKKRVFPATSRFSRLQ